VTGRARQDAVGEFGSGSQDEALGEAVRAGAARWDLHDVDPSRRCRCRWFGPGPGRGRGDVGRGRRRPPVPSDVAVRGTTTPSSLRSARYHWPRSTRTAGASGLRRRTACSAGSRISTACGGASAAAAAGDALQLGCASRWLRSCGAGPGRG